MKDAAIFDSAPQQSRMEKLGVMQGYAWQMTAQEFGDFFVIQILRVCLIPDNFDWI